MLIVFISSTGSKVNGQPGGVQDTAMTPPDLTCPPQTGGAAGCCCCSCGAAGVREGLAEQLPRDGRGGGAPETPLRVEASQQTQQGV